MKKKYLLSFCALLTLTTTPIVISCNKNSEKKENKNEKEETKNEITPSKKEEEPTSFSKLEEFDSEFVNFYNNFENNFSFDYSKLLGYNKPNNEVFPTQFQRNFKNIDIKLANELNKKYDVEIQNASYILNSELESNLEGKLNVTFKLKSKNQNKIILKSLTINNFKKSPNGIDQNGKILSTPSDSLKPKKTELSNYITGDQNIRFAIDNNKYMESLKRQHNNKPWNEYRNDLINNVNKIDEFNSKSKELNLDSYENLAHKGWTLPKYDESGNFLGLSMLPQETNKGPSWTDALGRNEFLINGLARTLPNEKYRQAALQTFSISFSNKVDFNKLYNPVKNSVIKDEDLDKLEVEFKNNSNALKLISSIRELNKIIKAFSAPEFSGLASQAYKLRGDALDIFTRENLSDNTIL
ncbi:hypothetical protein [Mycoplasma elephantis]|uniref:hypothetical protein n=1 Tax=Mycoplasma elephantis TaxID=114882 RepID=UPI0005617A70|nr:hypothetical protein [Mycoplasma elephantis]